MRLRVCKKSRRSIRLIFQSLSSELGRVSVVQLVKVPPYSIVAADRGNLQPAPARSNEDTKGLNAVFTVWYHDYSVRISYSFLDAVHFIPNFKPRFGMPFFASTEKRP